ncbi:MAG: hypothetical protein ABDK92_07270 [Atribacterota bacterium]
MKRKQWARIIVGMAFTLFIAGCFVTPAEKFVVQVKGVVANPADPEKMCYLDFETNPVIVEGIPLPNAELLINGDQGSRLSAKTDTTGAFEFFGQAGEAYVIYATKDSIRIKKGIGTLATSLDSGEANYFTTSQVIIWEVANELYPSSIAIKDIPFIQPTAPIVEAVKKVLANCEDAQGDPDVRALVVALVNTLFGAPGEGGVDITGGGEGNAGGGEGGAPTPTPTPTMTPTIPPSQMPTMPPCTFCR